MVFYKEARTCECGYTTLRRAGWYQHRNICKQRPVEADAEKEQLRERVAVLEAQVAADREQLAAALERNAALEQMLGQQLLDVKEELKQTKKRKDRYAQLAATRCTLTEPERRKIAQGQGWRCADPDGGCLLPGELQEFDIDHVTPIWKGGQDEPGNMQALCPACHRRKTNRERCERATGVDTAPTSPGPVM